MMIIQTISSVNHVCLYVPPVQQLPLVPGAKELVDKVLQEPQIYIVVLMDILVILQIMMSANVKLLSQSICLFYNTIECSNQCLTCTDAGSTVCASCKVESPVR